jgi:hypothetical protein
MRSHLSTLAGMALCLAAVTTVEAEASNHSTYSALDLLSPCQESDNDARWGEAAETECEQYIMGFVDALHITGQSGQEKGICVPAQNTADEVRWAFMRWVHGAYGERKGMPAGEALHAALKDSFKC